MSRSTLLQTVYMRSTRTLLIVASVILVAGFLMVVTSNNANSYGWFAYAPESESVAVDSGYLLTTREVIGWAALWVASLILTGVVVRYRVLRRLAPNDDQPE